MKIATPVVTEDFSWYTDKKRVKDLKNSSDSLKWKTLVVSLKERVIEVNKKAEASNKAFMQPLGKKIIAVGMLSEDFNRLDTKMRNLHNTKTDMLEPKLTNEHSTWHENCHQALKAILKQWINPNHNMEWVSRRLALNLKERGHGLMLCRLEDKLSLGFERERQLNEKMEEMIRRKEHRAKLATLVEHYNHFLDKMDKIDDQTSKHLKPDADKRMRCRQKQKQTTGMGNVNKWMDLIQYLKNESPSVDAEEIKQVFSKVDNQNQETSLLMASNENAEQPPTADEGNNGLTVQQIAQTANSACYQCPRSINSETALFVG